jgi:hypothetical protein
MCSLLSLVNSLTVSNTCFISLVESIKTKQIEEHTTKLKDTFEFVEKHGSDKQAFLLTQTLKTDLSDIEETIATLTEKAKYSTFKFEANEPCDTMKSIILDFDLVLVPVVIVINQ